MTRFPCRLTSLLVIIGGWNALIFLDLLVLRIQKLPGPGSILALGGLAAISGLLPSSQRVQRWVLKTPNTLTRRMELFCYGLCVLCLTILVGGLLLLLKKA